VPDKGIEYVLPVSSANSILVVKLYDVLDLY